MNDRASYADKSRNADRSSDADRPSYAVVTGGSSGIGFELACRAVERGYHPVLVARRFEALQEAAAKMQERYGVTPQIKSCDLCDYDDVERLMNWLDGLEGTVGLAINNAGLGFGGSFNENSAAQEWQVTMTNVMAVMRLSHYFVNGFLKSGKGQLLNVASLAGFQPGPFMSNYYACKAYVISFTEALAVELRGSGVTVAVLCPGTTGTHFHAKAGIAQTGLAKGLFGLVMTPEEVSNIAYAEWAKGRVVIIPGRVNQLAALGVRFAPRSLVRYITSRINEQPGQQPPVGWEDRRL